MKKVTRLLILTAFLFPICIGSRTYAAPAGPGHGDLSPGLRERFGHSNQVGDPIKIVDPNGSSFDLQRDDLSDRDRDPHRDPSGLGGDHDRFGDDRDRFGNDRNRFGGDRDPHPGSGGNGVGNGGPKPGGATAPLDGGIGLLLVAGLGLGLKKSRDRKKAAAQKNIENA